MFDNVQYPVLAKLSFALLLGRSNGAHHPPVPSHATELSLESNLPMQTRRCFGAPQARVGCMRLLGGFLICVTIPYSSVEFQQIVRPMHWLGSIPGCKNNAANLLYLILTLLFTGYVYLKPLVRRPFALAVPSLSFSFFCYQYLPYGTTLVRQRPASIMTRCLPSV